MMRASVLLGVSAALVACSADQFATPAVGSDGGSDAVVDASSDTLVPPADAPVDAPKPWCLEPAQISFEACADFDEGSITSAFSKGVAKTIVCGGSSGGTATLVSPSSGGGRLELAGASASQSPDAACAFKFEGSTKNSYIVDFDMPVLNAVTASQAITLASFVFDTSDVANCGFDLQFVPTGNQQVKLQWLHDGTASGTSPVTTMSHVQIKVDYNPGTQEFAVSAKADNVDWPVNYPPGCNTSASRTTVFSPHLSSPVGNGPIKLQYDKILVAAF